MKTTTEFLGKILWIDALLLTILLANESVKQFAGGKMLGKSASTSDVWMDCNRMNGVFRNNGTWFYDNVLGDWGLEWPKGSGLSPIFAAGQFLCAEIDGEVRVAGTQHSATEYQPGMILSPDHPDDPTDSKYKWYELRSDRTGDWTNWPSATQGAPLDEDGYPLLIGDQTIFSVWNDLAEHKTYRSQPLNAEVRQMAWAFDRTDAFGDMVFLKWTIVNKSGKTWEDAHFAIWSDPDVGNAGDDLAGCDTILDIGFCYNKTNTDQNYGEAPPAVGFKFLQGPIPSIGDTTTFPDGTVIYDKKTLGMTAFVKPKKSDSFDGSPHSAQDIYNFFHGKWRNGYNITEGGNGIDQNNPPTDFMFTGDPEFGTGWLDPENMDCRFFMITGPFTMEPWSDTDGDNIPEFGEPGVQEIVACALIARGLNNLNSVTKLKQISHLVQLAYNRNYQLAVPPKSPNVTVSELPNEILLSWDGKSEYNSDGSPYESTDPLIAMIFGDTVITSGYVTRVVDDSTYNFHQYVLYQYSDETGNDPVEVDTWNVDRKYGYTTHNGARFFRIRDNKNPKVGTIGDRLVNGKTYYFGLVAEGYLKDGNPEVIASRPTIVCVTPRFSTGVRYESSFNDTLEVTHLVTETGKPIGDGKTTVWVVDPSRTTGLDYTVSFNPDQTWNLTTSGGDTVLANQTNQTGNNDYNVTDGLLVKVQGPDPGVNLGTPGAFGDMTGFNGFGISGGQRWVSWPVNSGLETMGGSFGNGSSFFGSNMEITDYVDIEIRFAGIDSWPQPDSSSVALMAASKAQHPDRWSKAVVYTRPDYDVQNQLADVPFVVWDTENNRQLKVAICEETRPEYGNNNFIWDMGWTGKAFSTYGGREYVFILNETYDGQYTDYINGLKDGLGIKAGAIPAPVMYAAWWGQRGTIRPFLQDAFEFQIYASNPNTLYDLFTFKAPAAAVPTTEFLKKDLKKINVVPNPYYGYSSEDINSYDYRIRFTYLPEKCTIKIFNIAGTMVRKLEKNDPTTPFLDWDLLNFGGMAVSSGVYVYHVDAPGIGEKVGKLAVFIPYLK
ncbi:MAG: hypothetical protein WC703_01670 [Candidatus Neomarinimicrobiota bacterium]